MIFSENNGPIVWKKGSVVSKTFSGWILQLPSPLPHPHKITLRENLRWY